MERSTTQLIKDLRKQASICREQGVMVTVSLLMNEAADRLKELTTDEIDIPSDYPKLDPKLCECGFDMNQIAKKLIDEKIGKLRARDDLPKM